MNQDFKKFSTKILEGFPQRNKEVVLRRFGLAESREMETLEAIGRDHNITRERVRQIENDTLKKLKEKITSPKFAAAFGGLEGTMSSVLDRNGGIMRESSLLEKLVPEGNKNFAYFLLSLSPSFKRIDAEGCFYPVWTNNPDAIGKAKMMCQTFEEIMGGAKKTLSDQEVMEAYEKELKAKVGEMDKEAVFSHLGICSRLAKTVDQKWGLSVWAEVNPKTIKDKIEMVLKRENKPLHFQDISRLIEHLNSRLANVKKISPHIQTVHNELIKNDNFILVGRGMYALREWGYQSGQVKDIIAKVLKESSGSLTKEEIVQAVSNQRSVKESTILSSLRNKNLFAKDASGKYQIREA